jgi:hypothetical protein
MPSAARSAILPGRQPPAGLGLRQDQDREEDDEDNGRQQQSWRRP